jgi:hypothetical protein
VSEPSRPVCKICGSAEVVFAVVVRDPGYTSTYWVCEEHLVETLTGFPKATTEYDEVVLMTAEKAWNRIGMAT